MAARSSSADRLGSSEVLERAGNVQTRRFELSAPLLPEPRYPFLKKLFADGGYQGPQFRKAILDFLRVEVSDNFRKIDPKDLRVLG